MGNFYVNFSVRSTDTDKIATALEEDEQLCLITPPSNGYSVIFDRESDGQDPESIAAVGQVLSASVGAVVFAVLNHDDDILCCWLFENGKLSDYYNSAPHYFGDEPLSADEINAKLTDPQHLCTALGVPDAIDAVRRILGRKDYLSETDRHAALVEALQLPLWSVGFGFRHIERGELPSGLKLSDLRRVG